MGEGIIGAAAATGQAIRVGDVRSDPRYLNALDAVRSELAVPLIVRGRVIGVLDIESNELDYFTPYQQTILTLVASRIGTAIENAKLYEHERSQSETLLLLNEVGREANSSLSVEEVLRRAAELTKRLINYQIFSILLYDEADKVFRHRVTVKFGQRVQEKFAVPGHEGIVGAAASLKRAVVVPDVTLDPRYLLINPETRSELAVPMLNKDRVIGVMDLESPQLNYFTPDHVQALSILAAHLAVSIENARLYEQLARDELAYLLKNGGDVDVVAQGKNGLEAVSLIKEHNPDLVFLDVQMPGLDGFGVIKKLLDKKVPLPKIVFATAFDQYAVKAFEVNAVDYLLKPFDKKRVAQSVQRARTKQESGILPAEKIDNLVRMLEMQKPQLSKILLKSVGRMLLVDQREICYASIEDGVITVVTAGLSGIEGHSNCRTLEELLDSLDPNLFWRAHRSFLVNINRIREVVPWFKSSYQLRMDDKKQTEVPVSRAQTKRLRELFGL